MWEAVSSWLLESGILILIILLLSYIAYRAIKVAILRLVEWSVTVRGKGRRAQGELAKRSQTLSRFLTTALGAVIAVASVFMVLSEVGIDIAPLIAGAGVAGIAIGFGAQSLIKDYVSGLFIILDKKTGIWAHLDPNIPSDAYGALPKLNIDSLERTNV